MLDNFNTPSPTHKKSITNGPLPPGFKTWGRVITAGKIFDNGEYVLIYTDAYLFEQRVKEIEAAAKLIDAKYPDHNQVFELLMLIQHGIRRW